MREAARGTTTALGAIETLQGSEYGLQTRALCCEALKRAGSPQAEELRLRALRYVERLQRSLRDGDLRNKFLRRKAVISLMGPSGELFQRSASETTAQRRASRTHPW